MARPDARSSPPSGDIVHHEPSGGEPHEAKPSIRRTALSFVRSAEPVDWNGKPAEFVAGVAGAGDDHLALLSRIAGVFTDSAQVAALRAASTPDEVVAVLDAVKV